MIQRKYEGLSKTVAIFVSSKATVETKGPESKPDADDQRLHGKIQQLL